MRSKKNDEKGNGDKDLVPIWKFNSGLGGTLCRKCYVIITTGLTDDLYCEKCKDKIK